MKKIIEIDDSITELYPGEDLKIDLLEEQLLFLEKEQGLNEIRPFPQVANVKDDIFLTKD